MSQDFFEPILIDDEYFYTVCLTPFFYEGNDKKIFDICVLVSSESAFGSSTDLIGEVTNAISADEDFEWLTLSSSMQWSVSEVKAVNSYEEYQAIKKLVPHHTVYVEQDFSE